MGLQIGGFMKKSKLFESNRREFITRVIPACSALCLGGGKLLALTPSGNGSTIQQETHIFDQEYPRRLTYKQFFAARYGEFLRLATALEKEFGKEKTIELLKKFTAEGMMQLGQTQAEKATDQNLKTYTAQFSNPDAYKNTLTKEVVEDTDKAFELKVTECIWATTFLNAKAGDIGYAAVCWGDYAWAEGFNPKIKLVRDKTLMQGHDYCNHRYVWTG
jgi:hypothetical protein